MGAALRHTAGDLPKPGQKKPGVVGKAADVPREPCVINTNPTVFSASFGIHTGPDTLDNILRPVTSDRVRIRRTGLSFPTDPADSLAAFGANPNDRRLTPLALSRDYPARCASTSSTCRSSAR